MTAYKQKPLMIDFLKNQLWYVIGFPFESGIFLMFVKRSGNIKTKFSNLFTFQKSTKFFLKFEQNNLGQTLERICSFFGRYKSQKIQFCYFLYQGFLLVCSHSKLFIYIETLKKLFLAKCQCFDGKNVQSHVAVFITTLNLVCH